eukprot:Filipodium_phascolosomae@DN2285_c0_g1_i2.p1
MNSIPGRKAVKRTSSLEVSAGQEQSQLKRRNVARPVRKELDPRIESILELMFDKSIMQERLAQLGYDSAKKPLAKVDELMIDKGFTWLTHIAQQISNGEDVTTSSAKFYRVIPMTDTPSISDRTILRSRMQLIETLRAGIETSRLHKNQEAEPSKDRLQSLYEGLDCSIVAQGEESYEYSVIQKFVEGTAPTHGWRLKLRNVFSVEKDREVKRFEPHSAEEGRWLLCHGTHVCNIVPILSQGLYIPSDLSPEKDRNMFGKGVYFADVVTKAAQYCRFKWNTRVLLVLCEVALSV